MAYCIVMGDQSTQQKPPEGSFGFFHRILSLFLGSGDPERERRRRLKQIGKDLQRQKFKYYKPRSGEALPGLARLFFDIYKVVGPAQSLLQGADNSNALKTILIEANHSEEQERLREEFSEETIRERAEKVGTKDLTARIKDAMVAYFSGFDAPIVKQINDTYNLIQIFVAFVKFDYYFVLRKFDSSVQEGNFGYTPRFESINAEYVSDDIKDFLEVALAIERDADWDSVFDVLRDYKGVEVVDRSAWKKTVASLANVLRSGVLVQIVQHVDKEPGYRADVRVSRKHIVEGYLNTLKTQVEGTIQKLARERRTKKVEQLVRAVFGTTAVQRAKFYTDTANMAYTKKMLAGFLYIEAFNYLKAFLVDYFKGEVRATISDLFIVRGQWADTILSQQLSDSYYSVMNIAQKAVEFDDSLSEEGELGMKLKKASGRVVERDASTSKMLRQTLHEVNETALQMIQDTATNLITMGKVLKLLIDDVEKEHHELIQNWKELDSYTEDSLHQELVRIYKRAYYFVQLMQMFVKK
ncbi:MAG: DUF5312 family protein [Spirochaetota bacterium]